MIKKSVLMIFTIAALVATGTPLAAMDLNDLQIGAFVSQGYMRTDHNNYLSDSKDGSFEFNDLGLSIQGSPMDNLTLGVQLFARDLGDVGNDDVTIGWAFGEYSIREWIGVRAGYIKIPFGIYNETRDYDMLRTSIFLPGAIYNEWARDGINNMKGVQFFGNIDIGKGGLLRYQLQTGAMSAGSESGTALFYEHRSPIPVNIDSIKTNSAYVANLEWLTPLDGLRFYYTSFYVNTIDFDAEDASGNALTVAIEDSHTMVFSAEYIYNNLTVAGECQLYSAETTAAGVTSEVDSGDRYYVSTSYRFTDWFESGIYYSVYEESDDSSDPENELEDICASFRFDINPNLITKFEVHKMDGLFGVLPEDDGSIDEDWTMFAAKITYTF